MTGLPEGAGAAEISQKPIELILLRELASRLAMPVALYDAARKLVYLNEAAEELFCIRCAELGEISQRAFMAMVHPRQGDGTPIPADHMPSGVALNWRRPKRGDMWVYDAWGEPHCIAATGIPLEAQGGGLVGAMTVFWEIHTGAKAPPTRQ